MSRPAIKLLLDEHIWQGLTAALTQRGSDVIHLNDTGHRGIDDEALLVFATAQGRAVLTYNTRHFVPLIRLWYEANREHAGVILSVQLPPGELLRQAVDVIVVTPEQVERYQHTHCLIIAPALREGKEVYRECYELCITRRSPLHMVGDTLHRF